MVELLSKPLWENQESTQVSNCVETSQSDLQDHQTDQNVFELDTHFWSRLVEQRREERVDFRTTGYAYSLGNSGLTPVATPVRIWTVDVSTTGCLVRSYEPIRSKRLLIELVMPQLSGSLIEACVMRDLQDRSKYLNGKEQESYLYGLQFSRIVNRSVMGDSLPQTELQQPDEEHREIQAGPVAESLPNQRTLVPLLSAVGLVIVYASMIYIF